ncbi:MAG: FecR domain-containing protein [Haliscomenobacter sp.]|uniref:FecR family protein n=1 Tax=Haliscomenobacter sp. TaxID=2717303 RepID=UPI0029A1E9A4|nr:FecR domain-containing protein [Haliscomenobacter sp.]MDX2069200.1 FecR domain-containing protein [Haliscomenobacter sp.]
MEHTLQEDLIGKYLSGGLNAGEEGELMAWVEASAQNREVFEEMVQLWSLSETSPETEFLVNLPKAWAALDSRIDLGETTLVAEPAVSTAKPALQVHPQAKVRSLNWAWSAAAAVALLAVAAWWVFMRDTTPETLAFSTPDNQSRSITLPDQSQIKLNENSTLSYTYDGETRKVVLSGEAFFDVEKDPKHPFVIETGEVQTRVVGTSFNIRAYPDEAKVKVSVKTGRVEVQKRKEALQKEALPLVLSPGNSAIYESDSETLEKAQDVATEDVDSWQQGTIVFPFGTALAEVIPAVEKFYNVQINADEAILDKTMAGARFSRSMKIQDALNIITESVSGKLTVEGDVFVISRGDQ